MHIEPNYCKKTKIESMDTLELLIKFQLSDWLYVKQQLHEYLL